MPAAAKPRTALVSGPERILAPSFLVEVAPCIMHVMLHRYFATSPPFAKRRLLRVYPLNLNQFATQP